jgi:glycosyltransferase involved in cell wall biosynthesis
MRQRRLSPLENLDDPEFPRGTVMQLVGLVKAADHVCCRYRLTAFGPWLAKLGHALEVRTIPASWLARFWFYRRLRRADAVIVQRRLVPAWELTWLRRWVKRLIFDYDDAVFQRDSYSERGPASAQREAGFARMVRAADAVVAGNAFLAQRAVFAGAGNKTYVVPTCVEPARYPVARHERQGAGAWMAWIGSASTMQGLEQSRSLWEHLGRSVPGIGLKLICDKPLCLEPLPVDFRPWSEANEGAELAGADVGVSWLPDDAWSQGKCGLKILQYMAAGLPVVANPVGVQTQMVQHGVTGFVVQTAQEWTDAIARLARDPDLRRRLGQAGRDLVQKEYSVASGAARWQHVLNELAIVNGARAVA